VTKHHLPREESIDALLENEMAIYSTSTNMDLDVILSISSDGNMMWQVPTEPVFFWSKTSDGDWAGYELIQ